MSKNHGCHTLCVSDTKTWFICVGMWLISPYLVCQEFINFAAKLATQTQSATRPRIVVVRWVVRWWWSTCKYCGAVRSPHAAWLLLLFDLYCSADSLDPKEKQLGSAVLLLHQLCLAIAFAFGLTIWVLIPAFWPPHASSGFSSSESSDLASTRESS